MAIDIRPDPGHRLGGHAIIKLTGAAAEKTCIVLRKPEDGNFLGPHGWQGSEHRFGPYEIVLEQEQQQLHLGPEIVNHLEPFIALEISFTELDIKESTTWPENILPAPDAHSGGGVRTGRLEPPPATPTLTTKRPSPPKPGSEDFPEETVLDHGEEDLPEAEPSPKVSWLKRHLGIVIACSLLGAILAAALWFWYPDIVRFFEDQFNGDDPAVTPSAVTPAPPAVTQCSIDTVNAAVRDGVSGEELNSLLEICKDPEHLDSQFVLCEHLIPAGNPECLMRYGEWYDPRFETASPFPKDLANAAAYYKRAISAGAQGAEESLLSVCTALRAESSLLSEQYAATYCE